MATCQQNSWIAILTDRSSPCTWMIWRRGVEQAGVWDVRSGRLVWMPEDAVLVAWTENGRQVLVLRRSYQRDPNRSSVLATPLQSEVRHFLERRSWPERKLLASCEIKFPTGCAEELAGSPTGNLATVTWVEQDCAGFVLVRCGTNSGDYQISGVGRYGHGYRVEPNLIQGPVFSPDGGYAAASCSLWSWWAPGGDPETPSPGGRIKAGHLVILDTTVLNFTEREVFCDVPVGWLPPDSASGPMEMIGFPAFIDERSLRLDIPTGQVETFTVT